MDFYKTRTWQVVVKFEKIAGFWPFGRRINNAIICSYFFLILHSLTVPLATRLFHEWNKNIFIVVENLMSIMLIFGTSVKVLAAYFFQEKRKKVYLQIIKHLKRLREQELQIMTDYIDFGLKFTLAYLISGLLCLIIFDGPSIFKTIFNIFSGNSTDKVLPYYLEYGIDQNKYGHYIICHIMLVETSGAIVIFAYDLPFVLAVQHSCALLKIATFRLKKVMEVAARYKNNGDKSTQGEHEARRLLIMVIDIHNEALKLIPCIDATYNISWFFKLIETVISTGGLLSVLIAITTNTTDFIRYSAYLMFTLIQFNVPFNRGQQIIDYSSAIFDTCYDCEWENFSKNSIFFLRMIMTRSSKASYLTGGKIFELSNKTYGNMMKTAFSYCTVFTSFVK